MASVLDFERYAADLNRQLLRRIGYTNGLHKIERFARVVEYLYEVMPTSKRLFAQIVIEKENAASEPHLTGPEYAKGIIDVAQALDLIEKFGPKLSLSSSGYACHALNVFDQGCPLLSFLLASVIASDGEYTLNILRLIYQGHSDVEALGSLLMDQFRALIDLKIRRAQEDIPERFAQRMIIGLLSDAKTKLEKALRNKSVSLFYRHTVTPRVEWLSDLGCIEQVNGSKAHQLTPAGLRLLTAVGTDGDSSGPILLPLD